MQSVKFEDNRAKTVDKVVEKVVEKSVDNFIDSKFFS